MLGMSRDQAYRQWRYARSWVAVQLGALYGTGRLTVGSSALAMDALSGSTCRKSHSYMDLQDLCSSGRTVFLKMWSRLVIFSPTPVGWKAHVVTGTVISPNTAMAVRQWRPPV